MSGGSGGVSSGDSKDDKKKKKEKKHIDAGGKEENINDEIETTNLLKEAAITPEVKIEVETESEIDIGGDMSTIGLTL